MVLQFLTGMNFVGENERVQNPARIPPQTPPAGGKSVEAKRKILLPRKTDFRFAESVLKPHALPEYLEGRTPKEKHPFIFQEKIHPRQIRNVRSVFSFGVAGVLASACGFLRIICFENRFELGTINTPISNFFGLRHYRRRPNRKEFWLKIFNYKVEKLLINQRKG